MNTRTLVCLALLALTALACRGGGPLGRGAACSDRLPCRAHFTCNAGICVPEKPAQLDAATDAGTPEASIGDVAAERDASVNEVDATTDLLADTTKAPVPVTCASTCAGDDNACCDDVCTNLSFDPHNCGRCGAPCVGDRATEACIDARCVVAKCEPNWADCNGDPTDGCEASLLDQATCGSCSKDCRVDHGASRCIGGSCTPIACDKGYLASDRVCLECKRPVVALCGRGKTGILCAVAGPDGTLAAPTLFTSSFSDADGMTSLARYSTIQFPDVNGDGNTDVCARHGQDGVFCALGDAGSRFADATQWTNFFEDDFWGASPDRFMSLRFPDLNGDGKSDLCAQAGGDLDCMLSESGKFVDLEFWEVDFAKEPTWVTDPSLWGTMQFANVDGDDQGRPAVCSRFPDGIRCGRGGAAAFRALSKYSDGENAFSDASLWTDRSLWETIQFPDVDGDGRADVCSRTSSSILCQRAISPGHFGSAFELAAFGNIGDQPPPASVWATIQFPDINGDGKADVCGRQADGLWCALSTGTGFQPLELATPEFRDARKFSGLLYAGSIQFADLDGDGADDVCGRRAEGILCALSDREGHFGDSKFLAAFTDADGWSRPESASTLSLVYLTRDTRKGCFPQLGVPFQRAAGRMLR